MKVLMNKEEIYFSQNVGSIQGGQFNEWQYNEVILYVIINTYQFISWLDNYFVGYWIKWLKTKIKY